jgi:hypothetical protein
MAVTPEGLRIFPRSVQNAKDVYALASNAIDNQVGGSSDRKFTGTCHSAGSAHHREGFEVLNGGVNVDDQVNRCISIISRDKVVSLLKIL